MTTSTDGAERQNGPLSTRGQRTRDRLVEAAKAVFEDLGFLDARVLDITQRAGMSQGSFYYYFDSKEEIFREVAAAVETHLSAPLGVVVSSPRGVPPEARLREAIGRHFASYRDEARIMGVIEQVSRYDEQVRARRQELHRRDSDQIAESIRQLQRRGMADPDLDPAITAKALGAMTARFAETWLVEGELTCSLDEGVDQIWRLFVNALGLRRDGVRQD